MKSLKSTTLILLLPLAALLLPSCKRDPNVRKQNYYKAAVRYFDKGKYDAAVIELRNAIQIDPRYTDAHYEMAECDMRMGLFQQPYKELSNTVWAQSEAPESPDRHRQHAAGRVLGIERAQTGEVRVRRGFQA